MRASTKKRYQYLAVCLLLIALFLLQATSSIPRALAAQERPQAADCPRTQDVTSHSLLVVLLDRSGSLTSTDPDGYSTSITKALADLWPGSMAVIPFSNESTPVWGPYTLSDQNQREALKNTIQNYPIGGDTPLAPAMQKALKLFKSAPAGSRAVIVTDGNPDPQVLDGEEQTREIEDVLIPQFCAQNIPVSTFGLTLDIHQSDGQMAEKLLGDIASRTGGDNVNVENADALAKVIIQLFSQWLHLAFIPAHFSQGSYAVPIDTYAKKVIFVAFRSQSTSNVVLKGPDAQPLPDGATQRFTDRHYEIANLLVSTANQPGTYSVTMGGDPDAQVYALVETGLHVVLLQPTAQTSIYTGQPFTIQAALFNDAVPVIPRPNEATLNVDVTVIVHGQTVYHSIVELTQANNDSLFAHQITLPGPSGQLHLQVIASYLLIPVEASTAQISIPLQQSLPASEGLVCGTNTACSWLTSPFTAIGGISSVFLLLFLVLLLSSSKPEGWLLTQSGHTRDLGEIERSLVRRIFYRSVLNSRELVSSFDFGDANFDLIFRQGLRIKVINDDLSIKIKTRNKVIDVKEADDELPELNDKDTILIEKCAPAVFSQKREL